MGACAPESEAARRWVWSCGSSGYSPPTFRGPGDPREAHRGRRAREGRAPERKRSRTARSAASHAGWPVDARFRIAWGCGCSAFRGASCGRLRHGRAAPPWPGAAAAPSGGQLRRIVGAARHGHPVNVRGGASPFCSVGKVPRWLHAPPGGRRVKVLLTHRPEKWRSGMEPRGVRPVLARPWGAPGTGEATGCARYWRGRGVPTLPRAPASAQIERPWLQTKRSRRTGTGGPT